MAGGSGGVNPGNTANAKPWYMYPFVAAIGTPDPYGGFPKPDVNVQAPAGTPITALLPGTVSGVNSIGGAIPPYGAVVTVKLQTPINNLATHTAYLHLARVAPNITPGQWVNSGDVIGYSGGVKPAGSQPAYPGFALYNGDYYGQGAAWNLMTLQNVTGPLNPLPILQGAATGNLNPANPGQPAPNVLQAAGSGISSTVSGWLSGVQPLGVSWGEHIAIFLVALLMIGGGLYLLAGPEIKQGVQAVAGTAAKVAA